MSAAPDLTVVVPLYNAAAYLRQCLDSVAACPSDAVECILIDDGSTDGSAAICGEYAARDSRFRLIRKENTGVSDSRNRGIDQARGTYLLFLDADDFLKPDAWPILLEAARAGEYDLAAYGYDSLFSSGRTQPEQFPIGAERSADPADLRRTLLTTPMLNTCWGKLLRRETALAHGIRFREELRTCEDTVFMLDFAHHARTFLLDNRRVLFYRIHPGSVTRRLDIAAKLGDFQQVIQRRREYAAAHPDPALADDMARHYFSVITNLFLECAARNGVGWLARAYREALETAGVREILASVKADSLSPVYKRLEFALMRRGRCVPLALYFRAKRLWPRP